MRIMQAPSIVSTGTTIPEAIISQPMKSCLFQTLYKMERGIKKVNLYTVDIPDDTGDNYLS